MTNPISQPSEMTLSLRVPLPRQFDVRSVPTISEQFETVLEQQYETVLLDFSQVEFIDSSAIGAVIFLFKRLHSEQRQLKLFCLSGQPRRTLTMLKVDKAIPFIDEEMQQ